MRKYLVPLIALAIIAWLGLVLIIYFVPPKINDQLIIINVFYFLALLFFAVATTIASVLYFAQALLRFPGQKGLDKDRIPRAVLRRALRRGFILASALTVLGLLQLTKTNNYLNTVLVLAIATLFEIYLTTR